MKYFFFVSITFSLTFSEFRLTINECEVRCVLSHSVGQDEGIFKFFAKKVLCCRLFLQNMASVRCVFVGSMPSRRSCHRDAREAR